MTIKRILVGTDFSEQAGLAVDEAMELAIAHRAELLLVHGANLAMQNEGLPYLPSLPASYFTYVEDLEAELRAKLSKETESLAGRGVEVTTALAHEAPELAILHLAKERAVDLIVVGSHGRSGLSKFLLGSVSEAVAQRAECDVLVFRHRESGPKRHILVPTDFSECSERALARAMDLADSGDTVGLLHCWQLPGLATYWGMMGEDLRESYRSSAESYGAKSIAEHTGSGVTLEFAEVEGDARHSIQERAEKGDIDLVVMGTRGRKGLKRVLLGSVAQSTLRHLSTSVYLVR